MKNFLFILILLMGFPFLTNAKEEVADTLSFEPIYQGPGDDEGGGRPRSPITTPVVLINDHTLYFVSGCDNTELTILDVSEDEVYSTSISEGMTMLVLPEWLQGTFELQIRCGQYIFVAEIEL